MPTDNDIPVWQFVAALGAVLAAVGVFGAMLATFDFVLAVYGKWAAYALAVLIGGVLVIVGFILKHTEVGHR